MSEITTNALDKSEADFQYSKLVTERELPVEVQNFFIELLLEHQLKLDNARLINSLNIRVNMHATHATIESTTDEFDKSKHYLDQILESTKRA